jgi:hypothetical protein
LNEFLRGGSFNADTDDVCFEFVAGTYNYSIAGFSAADQLVFPRGAVPSVSNTSYTDGRVNLGWALGGQTIAVIITGLTTGQDAALNSTGDFNTVFGAGTVS